MLKYLGGVLRNSRFGPLVRNRELILSRVLLTQSFTYHYKGPQVERFIFSQEYSKSCRKPSTLNTSKPSTSINSQIQILQSTLKTELLKSQGSKRPTKEELLSDADGFLDRFKIRSKWFLIKDNRPFNIDELGTLFSWFFLSQIIWFVLGTTTFVSLLLFSINAILGTNKDFVSMILNKSWGSKNISFDIMGDVLPNWTKNCISMKNLKIKTTRDKITATTQEEVKGETPPVSFDLSINTVEITLSLRKWLKGNGLIDAITIIGVHGNIDLIEDPMLSNWIKNKNYCINKIVVQDANILYNQTYEVAIFNMRLPKFRFDNTIHDLLSSSVISGAINNSLFTLHKRQHNLASIQDAAKDISSSWERITRVHLDQIPVKQLGLPNSKSFSWIDDGELEFTADVMIPKEPPEAEEQHTSTGYNNDYSDPVTTVNNEDREQDTATNNKYLVIDLKLKFKDLKAKIPDMPPHLSTNEIICKLDELRPLVEYVNSKRSRFLSKQQTYNSSYIKNDGPDNTSSNASQNTSQEDHMFPTFQNLFNENDSHSATFPQITIKSWPEDEDSETAGKEFIKYHNVDSNNNNEIILTCRIVANTQSLKGKTLLKETKIYDAITMELYYDLMKMVEDWEYKHTHDWKRLWTATIMSQLLLMGLGSVA